MTVSTLTALLRHFDWKPVSLNPGAYEVWEQNEGEIIVPLAPDRGDFAALMRKAQESVERRYGRLATEVIQSLTVRTAGAAGLTHALTCARPVVVSGRTGVVRVASLRLLVLHRQAQGHLLRHH